MAFSFANTFRATPHKDCVVIAPEDFLSDEAKNVENPLWIHEAFLEIWRKIGKLASRKAVRRSLCGVALYLWACFEIFFAGHTNRIAQEIGRAHV